MTSDRKIAANRRNAQEKPWPSDRSWPAPQPAQRLAHGLAVAIGSQPSYSEDIEASARALVGDGDPPVEFARQADEAELDLLRIRKIRPSQFTVVVGNLDAPAEAFTELAENLAKLARYERCAYSRRERALQLL